MITNLQYTTIFKINVTSNSKEEVLEFILDNVKKKRGKLSIFTPNSEIAVYSYNHSQFRDILNQAQVAIPDGYWFVKGAQFLGKPLKQRIAGTDLMEELCKESVENAVSIGFLGGQPTVAEKAAKCLLQKYPGMDISFISNEWNPQGFETARKLMNTEKTSSSIGILFVAFGFPKQEEWISQNLSSIPVQAAMGVGGAFDFLSGEVKRAPKFLQNVGMEWLFRLVLQPWRFKRQLSLILFIILIIKERFSSSRS